MGIELLSRHIGMRDSKANIIALSGVLEEQALAYATDTGEIGIYTNGSWVWKGGAVTIGQYRQFLYTVVGGNPTFLTDDDGNILTVALDLE